MQQLARKVGLQRFLVLESPEIDSFAQFYVNKKRINSFLKDSLAMILFLAPEMSPISEFVSKAVVVVHGDIGP